MWKGQRVAVVIPAYNEERLIGRTLASLPDYVDAAYVVDDASHDGTSRAVERVEDDRVRCIRHSVNRGVGAALVTGYRAALADGAALMAVMAGDAQMDPADLPRLLDAVAGGRADYAKGNRFLHTDRLRMPAARRLAGRALSALTRWATGLDVDDSQCGFTVLSARAAAALPLDSLWPRYGYPNDLLGLLATAGFRVAEVPVRPVYADEASGVRPWHALTVAGVILRRRLRSRPRGRRFRSPT